MVKEILVWEEISEALCTNFETYHCIVFPILCHFHTALLWLGRFIDTLP
jgi:hypothetical protein